LESFHLCTEPFGRSAQRIIRKMGVALGCQRIRVAKQPTDNFQAEAARNEMRGVGVPIVVEAIIRQSCLPSYAARVFIYVEL
jgi:hypothetical protein